MDSKPTYTLPQLVLYFLKLGTTGFGGPVALVGYMQKDLVENRKCYYAFIGRGVLYSMPKVVMLTVRENILINCLGENSSNYFSAILYAAPLVSKISKMDLQTQSRLIISTAP